MKMEAKKWGALVGAVILKNKWGAAILVVMVVGVVGVAVGTGLGWLPAPAPKATPSAVSAPAAAMPLALPPGWSIQPGPSASTPAAPAAASGIWATWHPGRDFAGLAHRMGRQMVPAPRTVHHLMDFALVVGLLMIVGIIFSALAKAHEEREAARLAQKAQEEARKTPEEREAAWCARMAEKEARKTPEERAAEERERNCYQENP